MHAAHQYLCVRNTTILAGDKIDKICHPKESAASKPTEEPPSRRARGAGRIDVVEHGSTFDRPAAYKADAEEGDVDGARATRRPLAETMAAPRLT